MNNLLTSLAFSVYSNKGVYALMLGSGISRSSGIPTGWDIVLDLIRKLALLKAENCDSNEVNWFVDKYKEEPDYSTILSKLALQSSERVNLLKPYFEPTEEERLNHLKEPTIAHKAIAQLIKDGYIKVVITTNFDRLLENALREIGVEPQVIRHTDDIPGSMPLVHSEFTLIKVNGDYLDSRFLNTKQELSDYHSTLKEYILRVLNEYGLITCGWSAKWDKGLVNTIRQSENFRFSSFWSYVGTCEPELNDLAIYRKGNIVEISNADTFFNEIKERVEALSKMEINHPLNADIAVERLKKYIVKDENKILLHDLLHDEQERVYKKLHTINDFNFHPNTQNVQQLIKFYESSLEILLPLIISFVFWAKPEQEELIIKIISRISEPRNFVNGQSWNSESAKFYYIPSLILLYVIGVASVKSSKFSILNKIFHLKISEHNHEYAERNYFIRIVNPCMYDKELMNSIIQQNYYTPTSTWLCRKLKDYFKPLITNETEFDDIFDIFEYLFSLNYSYILNNSESIDWSPYGQYKWRRQRSLRTPNTLFKEFFEDADKEKDNWLPIKQGMFNGSYNSYLVIKKNLEGFLGKFHL